MTHIFLAKYALNKKYITPIDIKNDTSTFMKWIKFKLFFRMNFRNEIKSFKGHSVLLSSEHCFESLSSFDEVLRLKKLFTGLSTEIKIIIYVREQTEKLCSLYSTRMKGGRTIKMLSKDEFSRVEGFDYNEKIKVWEDVFGIENIILRLYDKEKLYNNDIVDDFCKVLNIQRCDSQVFLENTTLNAKQCEFLRLVNIHVPSICEYKVNSLRSEIEKMILVKNIESPPISDLISSEYQRVYEKSNKELSKRYFGEYKELFRMKTLNAKPLVQEDVLSKKDGQDIANQIIKDNKDKNVPLCKCIAAIFDVEYKGKKIPMEYVHSLNMNKSDKYIFQKIRIRIKSFIKRNEKKIYRM